MRLDSDLLKLVEIMIEVGTNKHRLKHYLMERHNKNSIGQETEREVESCQNYSGTQHKKNQ